MAVFSFTKSIFAGEPIDVFNNGEMQRDFTYIDDIVEAVVRVGDRPAAPDAAWTGADPDPATSSAPYRIFNIGNHSPVKLMRLIEVLEEKIGKKAIKRMAPMQPGDVLATYADVDELARAVDFAPRTPIETGIERFVVWYRDFYRV
jgi:UDP-glucuronate 4-epimerase